MNFEKLVSVGSEAPVEKVEKQPKKRISDSRFAKRRAFKKIKDEIEEELMETETTDEAIEVATEFLEEQEPEEVVQGVVEVLSEKIDELVEVNDSLRKRNLRLSDSLKKNLKPATRRKMSRQSRMKR